jgi:3-dehydroquinate synthase
MSQINVNTPSGPYAVVCQHGALARAGALVSSLHEFSSAFAVSSPRIWRLWGAQLKAGFGECGGLRSVTFDDREAAKNLRSVERMCRALVRAGADRRALLVALGGGVVGDVAGFVAACYLRGVAVVQVPTTLVAQVDSAIGGKTGVNLPEGKNLVGAFYQPRLVVVDPQVLSTLPKREYRSGIYEIIKYGVIGDAELFAYLERCLDRLVKQDAGAVDWVLPRCIAAKADVVSRDERESGLREILNFGHTFGHAIEAATRYRRFLHGEAVGWGMIAAARLAARVRILSETPAERIEVLTRGVGPLPRLPRIAPDRLLLHMRSDKKVRGGKLRIVLPRAVGKVETFSDIPEADVAEVIRGLLRESRR